MDRLTFGDEDYTGSVASVSLMIAPRDFAEIRRIAERYGVSSLPDPLSWSPRFLSGEIGGECPPFLARRLLDLMPSRSSVMIRLHVPSDPWARFDRVCGPWIAAAVLLGMLGAAGLCAWLGGE